MNAGPSTNLQDAILPHADKNLLIAKALGCVRGDKLLFKDLNFRLEAGQAGLLTGPNGVGKSSLLRLIANLLIPVSGSIQATESIALCDDHLALDENLSLENALLFWAQLDGKQEDDCHQAMAAAGLDHLAEVPVRYFSTGQRQRARLARTFLSKATLWLLDEPANGLDAASVESLGLALQAHLDGGGMILAASHIPLPIAFDINLQLQPPGLQT